VTKGNFNFAPLPITYNFTLVYLAKKYANALQHAHVCYGGVLRTKWSILRAFLRFVCA